MNSPYRILGRVELGRQAWDDFVAKSDDAWLWHRFDLQDALALWPGRSDASFAIVDAHDRVQALMPLHVMAWKEKRILPRSRMESLGGLACGNGVTAKQQAKLFQVALAHVANLADKGCQGLQVSLAPMAPSLRGDRCPRVNPLLLHGFDNILTQTWVIDLCITGADLWQRMEGRARTAVRKAEKSGVSVRTADRDGDLDVYYNLHVETYRRSGLEPHPRPYFEAIWRDFLAQGLAVVWFAEHEGEIVAAENFGMFKQAAIYWTGAASHAGLNLGANSLLQWQAMQAMQAMQIAWYETGEAFPGARGGKTKGLNDFKKSFGGSLFPYYKGWMGIGAVRASVEHQSKRS